MCVAPHLAYFGRQAYVPREPVLIVLGGHRALRVLKLLIRKRRGRGLEHPFFDCIAIPIALEHIITGKRAQTLFRPRDAHERQLADGSCGRIAFAVSLVPHLIYLFHSLYLGSFKRAVGHFRHCDRRLVVTVRERVFVVHNVDSDLGALTRVKMVLGRGHLDV